MKVEKLAKNGEKGQNCYPLSPRSGSRARSRARTARDLGDLHENVHSTRMGNVLSVEKLADDLLVGDARAPVRRFFRIRLVDSVLAGDGGDVVLPSQRIGDNRGHKPARMGDVPVTYHRPVLLPRLARQHDDLDAGVRADVTALGGISSTP